MQDIIRELYEGVQERHGAFEPRSEEYQRQHTLVNHRMQYFCDCWELSREAEMDLEELVMAAALQHESESEQAFVEGFRLGLRLTAESLL